MDCNMKILIAVVVLMAIMFMAPAASTDVPDINIDVQNAAQAAAVQSNSQSNSQSTGMYNPQGSLAEQPVEEQVVPPGTPDFFSQRQRFSQTTTAAPIASPSGTVTCPGFSELLQAERGKSPLKTSQRAMGWLENDDPYAPMETMTVKHEWEKNFQNDASLNTQYLSSLESGADPSRTSKMTMPNATTKADIRSDEMIAFDPAASCKLSPSLTRLQSNQGL